MGNLMQKMLIMDSKTNILNYSKITLVISLSKVCKRYERFFEIHAKRRAQLC